MQNCNGVLQQLNKLLIKYKSLGTKSKKAWDRLRWGTENLAEIREKIMSHTSSLNLFLTTLGTGSLGRIEKKLDQLIEDVKAGRREETILTMADDDEDEAEAQWNSWKNELADEGFTKLELESHKRWIKAKLKELIEGGGLYEDPLPEDGNAEKSHLPEKNLKPSKNVITSKKHAGLQPTVEKAEDEGEEDNGPRTDELNVRQEGGPNSESLPSEEELTVDQEEPDQEEPDQEEPDQESEASGSTGDTCLPSDSMSNVGINTAEVLLASETYTSQPQAPTLHHLSKKTPQSEGKAGSPSRFPRHGSPPGPILHKAPSDDLQPKNQKAKHKKSKVFNDSTSDLEEQTRVRERYKEPPEPKDQPAKSSPRSSIRNESPLYYRRNNRQNETKQTAPRKAQFSDREYFHPDRTDRTQSNNYYGEDFPPYHDRFVLPPRDMPDGNRDFQSEYSRDRPADPRDSPFDTSRNMYSEDQYADPRRFTSRDNPRPDYYHGPMPSDTYPPQSAGFNFGSPEAIFSRFLRGETVMGDASGIDNVSTNFEAGETTTHSPKPPLQASPSEVTIIERPLPLTLEELFSGTHKKMKIKVKSFHEFTGKEIHQDKFLEMDIKPGLKTGSKIKFKGAGFLEASRAEALHFIVEEVST